MLDHELRKLAIGGSEIGAILGVDEKRDGYAVWASRRLPRLPEAEKPLPMVIGTFLEEGILKIYTHQTTREVIHNSKSSLHPTRPWMISTPDALCRFERRGVDAKSVRWDQRHKWGEKVEDIPDYILAQCLWYCAALDYDHWDVAALIGGQDLRVYTVERDLAIEENMLHEAEEFYRRYLVGDEIPPITKPSSEAMRYLKERYPKNHGPMLKAMENEYDFLGEYSQLRTEDEDRERMRDWMEVVIKERIGEAEGIEWPQGRITYRACKDGVKIDWVRLADRLMQTMTQKECAVLISEFSSFKPGHRSLRWDYYEKPDPKALPDPKDAWVSEL